MKTNDLPTSTLNAFNGANVTQELEQFNRKRTARGLIPVSLEEFAELSLKVMGFGNWTSSSAMVH
ncbi:hypothetical protein [Polynucleobacter kasalickyi]|uniref:Uncharacterized protein n=1 Tax=Polynucleobacter kasalickyi TaxID=1938817 RepID=A0A1W1Y3G0_9BURK|nr:hypothetical protein [Polynucleobacter kasalickyi]SMC30676.1 hypothetical protein SAMN06296008_101244 [Polynucleobacter kasalickyi]